MSRQARNTSKDPPDLPPLFNLFTSGREQGSPEILQILYEARAIAENPKQKAGELCRLVAKLGDVHHLGYKTWIEFAEILQLPTEKIKNDLDLTNTDKAKKDNEALMRKYVNKMCMATSSFDLWKQTNKMIISKHNYKDRLPFLKWLLKYGVTTDILPIFVVPAEANQVNENMSRTAYEDRATIKGIYESIIGTNDKEAFNVLANLPHINVKYALHFIGLTNHVGFIKMISENEWLTTEEDISYAWSSLVRTAAKTRACKVLIEMNTYYPIKNEFEINNLDDVYHGVFYRYYKYIPPKYESFEKLMENAPNSIKYSLQAPGEFYPRRTLLLGYATADEMLNVVRNLFVTYMRNVYMNFTLNSFKDSYGEKYKDDKQWHVQEIPWTDKTTLLQYYVEDIRKIMGDTDDARKFIFDKLRRISNSILYYRFLYVNRHEPLTDWLGINNVLEIQNDKKIMPTPAALRFELLKYVTPAELRNLYNAIQPNIFYTTDIYTETFAPEPPNASGAGSSTDPMVD